MLISGQSCGEVARVAPVIVVRIVVALSTANIAVRAHCAIQRVFLLSMVAILVVLATSAPTRIKPQCQ